MTWREKWADKPQGHFGYTAIAVVGLVTYRQEPETAGGVVLPEPGRQDQDGQRDLPTQRMARHRRLVLDASSLIVSGRVERLDSSVSLLASRLRQIKAVAAAPSRDFR